MFDFIFNIFSDIIEWILNILNKPQIKIDLKKILWTILEDIIKVAKSEVNSNLHTKI